MVKPFYAINADRIVKNVMGRYWFVIGGRGGNVEVGVLADG